MIAIRMLRRNRQTTGRQRWLGRNCLSTGRRAQRPFVTVAYTLVPASGHRAVVFLLPMAEPALNMTARAGRPDVHTEAGGPNGGEDDGAQCRFDRA
jgi:hypothetical protein